MSKQIIRFELISFLVIAVVLVVSPVFGTVKSVNISPPVLLVDQPITFSGVDIGTISPNNPENNVLMRIYPGFSCAFTPSKSIAFATTPINPGGAYTGSYNTTLSFPAPLATSGEGNSGGWVVTSQSYQNGLPAGPYSVGVTDTQGSVNGTPGICKNFTVVSSSPVPEFTGSIVVTCSALAFLTALLLARRRRQRSWGGLKKCPIGSVGT